MNKFYIYIHRRVSDNKPFYVGKGCGSRAHVKSGRNPHWTATAKKHGLKVEIVFSGLTEEEAFECEKDTILEMTYFGYPLTNMSSGGEGNTGLKFTDRQRLNIAAGLRNRNPKVEPKVVEVKRPKSFSSNNHNADNQTYTFIRLQDGFEINCTRHFLREEYGVNLALLKKLFYTKPRKSASGWKLKDTK